MHQEFSSFLKNFANAATRELFSFLALRSSLPALSNGRLSLSLSLRALKKGSYMIFYLSLRALKDPTRSSLSLFGL
jgi:hypothetical protein